MVLTRARWPAHRPRAALVVVVDAVVVVVVVVVAVVVVLVELIVVIAVEKVAVIVAVVVVVVVVVVVPPSRAAACLICLEQCSTRVKSSLLKNWRLTGLAKIQTVNSTVHCVGKPFRMKGELWDICIAVNTRDACATSSTRQTLYLMFHMHIVNSRHFHMMDGRYARFAINEWMKSIGLVTSKEKGSSITRIDD